MKLASPNLRENDKDVEQMSQTYNKPNPPAWYTRFWFYYAFTFGFLVGAHGLLNSVGTIWFFVRFPHNVKLNGIFSGVFPTFEYFFLAFIPLLLFCVLKGQLRFAVVLEVCGLGAVFISLSTLYDNISALAKIGVPISVIIELSGLHTAGVVMGILALAGFRFCRPSMLRTQLYGKPPLLPAVLILGLVMISLNWGVTLREMSAVIDRIFSLDAHPDMQPVYATAFVLTLISSTLLPMYFFALHGFRTTCWVALAVFLPLFAVLVYQILWFDDATITEWAWFDHDVRALWPFITGHGVAIFAIICLLLRLTQKRIYTPN